MSKVFSDVQVFMIAAEQTVSRNNDEQALLYHRLITEEYNEFCAARLENDDKETIDACFDMIWVIVGYMYSRGWDCERIREDGKVLKPEGWQPPDFSKFVKK